MNQDNATRAAGRSAPACSQVILSGTANQLMNGMNGVPLFPEINSRDIYVSNMIDIRLRGQPSGAETEG